MSVHCPPVYCHGTIVKWRIAALRNYIPTLNVDAHTSQRVRSGHDIEVQYLSGRQYSSSFVNLRKKWPI